ncbi:heat shock protein 70 kDa [Trifolium pratense]|uniref:Heat shock protein 70 kDa n=1 Tax=Trifolium pratense TaxID=57577 RepID=A0A2K3NR66_TRIPR|nr:heat shock protein 70 kDa [Trifolium pratense]
MRRSTTAVELLGNFLAELKEMVETQMKRSIRNVVLTVPVSLSRLQINWIHCACVMAGLKVIRLMPQPTAVDLCKWKMPNKSLDRKYYWWRRLSSKYDPSSITGF